MITTPGPCLTILTRRHGTVRETVLEVGRVYTVEPMNPAKLRHRGRRGTLLSYPADHDAETYVELHTSDTNRVIRVDPRDLVEQVRDGGMDRTTYLLGILAEECGETVQRAIKAQRFGIDEIQPSQDLTNRTRLEGELGDLLGVADMLGLVPCERRRRDKPARVRRYSKISKAQGVLSRDESI